MTAYEALEQRYRKLHLLAEIEAMLDWDTAAMMPDGAAGGRAEQIALLRVLQHGELAAPDLPAALDEADASADALDAWQRANLAEMRRAWVHQTAVSAELVAKLSKAVSACEKRWRVARPESDFDAVRGELEDVVSLTREAAAARAERLGCSPYEALLDEHSPGVSCEDLDRLFGDLEAALPAQLERALARQAQRPRPTLPPGPFPLAAQEALGRRLMGAIGFDRARGRLDVSLHPFCGGTTDDVRITTRYDEADFMSSLMGVLHESGHALYQLGLPAAWRYQPVGQPRGMAVHESQSLLVEMQACRSRPFIEFLAPLAREAFGGEGPAWSADNLHALTTWVEPGMIRVDADEVAYPLHVILRYRLERAMIDGSLAVADLPDAWNSAFEKAFGTTPPDDRRGCLQDIHWFAGAFGYFPSYTLGAMMAAQLFRAAQASSPEVGEGIGKGDFGPLRSWLGEHVHAHGARYATAELLERATGSSLDPGHYRAHLAARYG